MKKITLYIFLCLLSLNALAQDNKRVLPAYGHTIKFEVSSNYLIIAEEERIDSFRLSEELNLVKLADTALVLNSLYFENAQIKDLTDQYIPDGEQNNAYLINALIKRATELEGQRIIFSGDGTMASLEEDLMFSPETAEDQAIIDTTFWLSVFGGVLGGMLIGLFLGMRLKKKPIRADENMEDKQGANIALLSKTKNELAQIKTSLQQQLDFDQQYFKQSFNTIIVPLENALEARDLKALTPLLIKAMAHYTAVTRFKLEKKQSFDLANMQILMGNTTYQKSDFPRIDKNSSPDDIPNKLKALIELLKNAEANGVEESIVAGYKLENL